MMYEFTIPDEREKGLVPIHNLPTVNHDEDRLQDSLAIFLNEVISEISPRSDEHDIMGISLHATQDIHNALFRAANNEAKRYQRRNLLKVHYIINGNDIFLSTLFVPLDSGMGLGIFELNDTELRCSERDKTVYNGLKDLVYRACETNQELFSTYQD